MQVTSNSYYENHNFTTSTLKPSLSKDRKTRASKQLKTQNIRTITSQQQGRGVPQHGDC